jgi:HEAT repeat protein
VKQAILALKGDAASFSRPRILMRVLRAGALVAGLGLISSLVIVPYCQVRSAVLGGDGVDELGGPRSAARKLGWYLVLPPKLAPGRKAAVRLLIDCGRPAVPQLADLLEDRNPAIRKMAAKALGDLGDQRAVEPLIRALADRDTEVRMEVVLALGWLGDRRAVLPLSRVMKVSTVEVRVAVIDALGSFKKDPLAIEVLAAALEDGEFYAGMSAAYVLGKAGEPALRPLIAMLGSSKQRARLHAARALGELGDPRAVEPLQVALTDSDPRVRRAARRALERLRAAPREASAK